MGTYLTLITLGLLVQVILGGGFVPYDQDLFDYLDNHQNYPSHNHQNKDDISIFHSTMHGTKSEYRNLLEISQEESIWYEKGNGSNTVFSKPDLTIAKIRGYDIIDLIYQRYEFHNWFWYQFFLASFNMPTLTWDLIKYKIAMKTMDSIITGKKSRFLMIFGGSSVTAGHDNYFNESYPMVFNRRMRPIFDALGIELVVRNIAQGGNPCRPADLCYEAMGGSNPDWLGWEQTYNCKSADIYELMAKVTLLNRAILYFTASGAYIPDYCEMSNDTIPWISEAWTPQVVNITQKYIPNRENITNLRKILNDWYEDGNAIGRFSSPLGGQYDGAAIHGFSVWGRSNHMIWDLNRTKSLSLDAYNIRPWCHEQGGPHWMTKQAALYSVGTGYKRWHPSSGFHMLRGEIMVYNYLYAIMDAILMMEDDLKNMTAAEASKNYQHKLDSLYIPPPKKTMHCHQEECGSKPRCYTDFTPNYNPDALLDKIIVGNHTGWNYVMKQGNGNSDPRWGYLDNKPAYEAYQPNAQIHFKIDIPRNHSLVMVCGSERDCLKHCQFYLDINATNIGPNYNLEPEKNLTLWTDLKYRGDECFNLWNVPEGKHVLSIITGPEHHRSAISHIITFE